MQTLSQRVAGFGMIELAEGDRFAGGCGPALLGALTDHLEGGGDAADLAFGRVERDAIADLA